MATDNTSIRIKSIFSLFEILIGENYHRINRLLASTKPNLNRYYVSACQIIATTKSMATISHHSYLNRFSSKSLNSYLRNVCIFIMNSFLERLCLVWALFRDKELLNNRKLSRISIIWRHYHFSELGRETSTRTNEVCSQISFVLKLTCFFNFNIFQHIKRV